MRAYKIDMNTNEEFLKELKTVMIKILIIIAIFNSVIGLSMSDSSNPNTTKKEEEILTKLDIVLKKVYKLEVIENKLDFIIGMLQQQHSSDKIQQKLTLPEENIPHEDMEKIIKEEQTHFSNVIVLPRGTVNEPPSALQAQINRSSNTATKRSPNQIDQDQSENANLDSNGHEMQKLSDGLHSLINVSNHILNEISKGFSEMMSRLRLFNVAQDKRLGAVLHATSARQRISEEHLLTALASIASLIRVKTEELKRNSKTDLSYFGQTFNKKLEHDWNVLKKLMEEVSRKVTKVFSNDASSYYDSWNFNSSENYTMLLDSKFNELQRTIENMTVSCGVLKNDLFISQVTKGMKNVTDTQAKTFSSAVQEKVPESQLAYGVFRVTFDSALELNFTLSFSGLLHKLWKDFEERTSTFEEQIVGLRIYYSTSLHFHTEQVRNMLEAVGEMIAEVVALSEAKVSKRLDIVRRSSLTLMDAAVTSVSSAAVASAQSTAIRISDAIEKLSSNLEDRIKNVSALATRGWCPETFTKVSFYCLLLLNSTAKNWNNSRLECQKIGSDLALFPDAANFLIAQNFLSRQNVTQNISFWIGGIQNEKKEDSWQWVSGRPLYWLAFSDVSEDQRCLFVNTKNKLQIMPTLCNREHGAICQVMPDGTALSLMPHL